MSVLRRFAGYPSAFVYDEPARVSRGRRNAGKPSGKVIEHLLWGQYVGLFGHSERESREGFEKVRIRNNRVGWMETGTFQSERILEVIFVDIGQGDGCLVVTPDDDFIIIDAGQHDNMYRFLRWRYALDRQDEPVPFTGIISHPDSDHYNGFDGIFDDPNIHFDVLYHNGILERLGSKSQQLGPKVKNGRRSYLSELVPDVDDLDAFLDSNLWQDPNNPRRNKQYPTMLKKGRDNGSFDVFEKLDVFTNGGFLKGYEEAADLSIQILGPVPEEISDQGNLGLRWIDDKGKTKNGHSIVLRLTYGDVSVLLGGDLNIESEKLLLEHHTEMEIPDEADTDAYQDFIEVARSVLQVDVAKSCHHGSADFFRPYLDATNPIVTVVSSGDAESHSHPRADALGTIGRYSRGVRSLIFNTELARSTGETIEIPMQVRKTLDSIAVDIDEIEEKLEDQGLSLSERESLQDEIDGLRLRQESEWRKLARSVDVYGAINLRSDGERIVMAQKLERKRGDTEWDIYRIEKPEPTPNNPDPDFEYQSKFEGEG